MAKAFDNLFWHDGNLQGISFDIDRKGKAFVRISARFYKDEQAPSRDAYQITCKGVRYFGSSLDSGELKDNMWAGNIANGYLKDDVLWIYFTDGFVQVQAKKFRLAKG